MAFINQGPPRSALVAQMLREQQRQFSKEPNPQSWGEAAAKAGSRLIQTYMAKKQIDEEMARRGASADNLQKAIIALTQGTTKPGVPVDTVTQDPFAQRPIALDPNVFGQEPQPTLQDLAAQPTPQMNLGGQPSAGSQMQQAMAQQIAQAGQSQDVVQDRAAGIGAMAQVLMRDPTNASMGADIIFKDAMREATEQRAREAAKASRKTERPLTAQELKDQKYDLGQLGGRIVMGAFEGPNLVSARIIKANDPKVNIKYSFTDGVIVPHNIATPDGFEAYEQAGANGDKLFDKIDVTGDADGFGLTATHKSKELADYAKFQISAEQADLLYIKAIELMRESPDSNTWGNKIMAIGGDIMAGFDTIFKDASSIGFSDKAGNKLDVSVEDVFGSARAALNRAGVRDAELQNVLIELAYKRAKAMDPSGRIAKDDFVQTIASLGGNHGNPVAFLASLEQGHGLFRDQAKVVRDVTSGLLKQKLPPYSWNKSKGDFQEGSTATNHLGERIIFKNGQWVRIG